MNWYTYQKKEAGISDISKKIAPYMLGGAIGLGALNSLPAENNKNTEVKQEQKQEQQEVEKESPKINAENKQEVKQNPTAFNYQDFIKYLIGVEGYKPKVYNDGRGISTIGIGHAFKPESKNIFNSLFGNEVNFDAVKSGKQTLNNQQIEKLAKYDIDLHKQRAKKIIPKFDSYPYYLQKSLLSAVYRGDLGPKTAALINAGKFNEAAKEYLNRKDYQNAEELGVPGIVPRMNSNRDAMLQYAKESLKK